jgi:hypothetical protein
MGGMRCILTGFAVGVMLGVGGFWAAGLGSAAPSSLHLKRQAAFNEPIIKATANVINDREGLKASLSSDLSSAAVLTIENEPGGYITDYAVRMMEWRANGVSLRFTGSCDSACTLYLALPYEQTCIAEGASFRFHEPIAESEHARRVAQEYMLTTYPDWVRSWIDAMGGLSKDLIRMDYDYARNYMKTCEPHRPREVLLTGIGAADIAPGKTNSFQ